MKQIGKTDRTAIMYGILFMLLFMVAFTDGAGKGSIPKQQLDSLTYYQVNTIINWELIQKRIKEEK